MAGVVAAAPHASRRGRMWRCGRTSCGRTRRQPAVVVDAKYKAEKPAGFPQADLYQLLAYCTVLGLRDGHLIYARGEEVPREHAVLGSTVRIHCHTLDLDARPQEVLEQVQHLAGRMISRHLEVAS